MRTRGTQLAGLILVFAGLVGAPAANAQLPSLPPLPGQGDGGGGGGSRPAQPGPPPPPSDTPGSVTDRVDVGHTGYVGDQNLTPPLTRKWSKRFNNGPRSVVYGDGRIYVLAGDEVIALDARSARVLWRTGFAARSALAFDRGRLFIGNDNGTVQALSAATGGVLWQRKIEEYYGVDSTPVATGGVVYVGASGGRVHALNAGSGAEIWQVEGNGTANVPAVDAGRVYASYACGWTYAWERTRGNRAWNSRASCSGGGGSTPAIHGGRLYVPENGAVYNAASGADLGRYPGGEVPAFAGNIGVFPDRVQVFGVDLRTNRRLWTVRVVDRRPEDIGSDSGVQAPVIVGSTAYMTVGRDRLLGLDVATGGRVLSTKIDDVGGALAVAPGTLLVPSQGRLTAYHSFFRPGPREIAAGPRVTEVTIGQRAYVGGVIGTALRGPNARVRLSFDQAPFGRLRPDATARAGADGYFEFVARPQRNSRVRFSSGGARSKMLRLYVYPKVKYRFRRRGRATGLSSPSGFAARAASAWAGGGPCSISASPAAGAMSGWGPRACAAAARAAPAGRWVSTRCAALGGRPL